MRSAIWKLSALATVIGLGLVAVVFQQKGLGKSTAAGTAATTSTAPQPKIPQQGKSSSSQSQTAKGSTAATADPFSSDNNEQPAALSELPPEQGEQSAGQEFENPPAGTLEGAPREELATGARTKSSPKARGRSVPPDTEVVEDPQGQFADRGASRRGRSGEEHEPPEPGRVQQGDPAAMEGTVPSDQESTALTDEVDPFAKRREALAAGNAGGGPAARGSRGRSAAISNQPGFDSDSAEQVPHGARDEANPFDQGGGAARTPVPATPPAKGRGRGRSRAMLIEEGEPPRMDRAAEGQIEIVEQPVNETIDSRAGVRARGIDPRDGQLPADNGSYIENEMVPVAGVETVPPTPPSSRARNRPRMLDDEDGKSAAGAGGDGLQTIPKKSSSGQLVAEHDSMPPVAQGKRNRPNVLRDDDEDSALPRPGRSPENQPVPPGDPGENSPSDRGGDPQIIDSAIPVPNGRRTGPRAIESGPNVPGEIPSEVTGGAEAAVSRDAETTVIAVPKRRTSMGGGPGGNLGAVGANRGRGRVTIEKRAPATAYLGQPLIYQIVVRNIGNGGAQQVVVEDLVPEGVSMQGSIPQAEMAGRKLTWRLGTLAAGEERKVSVKVIPNSEGAVGSAATVNFVADTGGLAGSDSGDGVIPPAPVAPTAQGGIRQASTQPVSNEPATGSGLNIEIQGPRQVNAGQSFDLRFRVTNRSNQPVRNLIIHKVLPEGLQHPRGQDLEYSLGTLEPGQVREIPMNLTAVQPGRAVSRIELMTSTYQTLETKEFTIDVGGLGNPEMGAVFPVTLERLGTAHPTVNRPAAYANRVTNRGTRPVSRLTVTESIPKGLEFVSVGDDGQFDEQNRKVVWTIDRLEPNASKDLEISLVTKDRIPRTTLVVAADRDGHQVEASLQVTGG